MNRRVHDRGKLHEVEFIRGPLLLYEAFIRIRDNIISLMIYFEISINTYTYYV